MAQANAQSRKYSFAFTTARSIDKTSKDAGDFLPEYNFAINRKMRWRDADETRAAQLLACECS